MTKKPKSCETCAYWRDENSPQGGKCRFHPPKWPEGENTAVNYGYFQEYARWPRTKRDDLCSGWRKK